MADCVDEGKDDDGLVSSEILIRDNCTENGGDITPVELGEIGRVEIPKLEEVTETRSTLLTETEITLWVIVGAILDVVLEWRRQSVESKSFAQFNDYHEPVDQVSGIDVK